MDSLKYKIALVPFPLGEILAVKNRPVLCLSSSIGKYNEVIVAYITSRIPDSLEMSDLFLNTDAKTGLKKSLL